MIHCHWDEEVEREVRVGKRPFTDMKDMWACRNRRHAKRRRRGVAARSKGDHRRAMKDTPLNNAVCLRYEIQQNPRVLAIDVAAATEDAFPTAAPFDSSSRDPP